jgi:hypothetical protein
VDSDALTLSPATVSRDTDIDRSRRWRKHSPDGRCTPMTHGSAIAEGEHSGHAPAFEAEIGVANGVNTAMKAVKPAGAGSLGRDVL